MKTADGRSDVAIRPYSEEDLWVLEKTLGDPSQMTHLAGPESPEKIRERHGRYLRLSADPSNGRMFTVILGPEKAPVGNVGYWEQVLDGEKVWETGWFTLPEFQGQGIATAATRLVVDRLARLGRHRYLTAFPSVDNQPSNAICRKLGFTLVEERDFEYQGRMLRCNIWRLDLVRPE